MLGVQLIIVLLFLLKQAEQQSQQRPQKFSINFKYQQSINIYAWLN